MAEQRGTLQSWNDDRGFGFIQPNEDGPTLFVHISAMRGDVRPSQGQTVFFVPGHDTQGRPRAEYMRAEGLPLDQTPVRQKPHPKKKRRLRTTPRGMADGRSRNARLPRVTNLPLKLALFAALCALPIAGSVQVLSVQGSPAAFLAYAFASLLTFWLYRTDKQNAMDERRRISEKHLHLAELIGGWPGALVAQQAFRHKTRKTSFQIVFWAIVTTHQLLWADWLLNDSRHLTTLLSSLLG